MAIAAMRALGDTIKEREQELETVEARMRDMLLDIPNLVLDDVPSGGEDDAVELRRIGEPRHFDFEPRDHLDLGVALDLIDMERAAKASGSRFAYLKGDLVLLAVRPRALRPRDRRREGVPPGGPAGPRP